MLNADRVQTNSVYASMSAALGSWRILNLKEAARRLGVHYQTAYRYVRIGRLIAVRGDRGYEVSEAALERFTAARSVDLPGEFSADPRTRHHGVEAALASGGLDPDLVITPIVTELAHELGDLVGAALLEEGRLDVVSVAHRDPLARELAAGLLRRVTLDPTRGPFSRVLASATPLSVPIVARGPIRRAVPAQFQQHVDELGLHSLAFAPIVVGGVAVGLIGASRDRPGRPYGNADLEILSAAATRVAHDLERLLSFRRAWGYRDTLTRELRDSLGTAGTPWTAAAQLSVDAASVPVVVLDANRIQVAVANPDAVAILGPVLDQPCDKFIESDKIARHHDLLDRLRSGGLEYANYLSTVRTRQGSQDAHVLMSAVAQADATPVYIVFVFDPVAEAPAA